MGLTMGCARCHNHKYDPFAQKEYYQLYAYFNSIPEDGRFSNFGNAAPWIPAPTKEQQKQLARIDTETTLARKQMDAALDAAKLQQRRWEKSLLNSPSKHWFPTDELVLHQPFDKDSSLVVHDVRPPTRP